MSGFKELLNELRWDDHRYYHHSVINQSLHLVSASTFVCAYILLLHDPAMASLLGWLVAMTSRQAGHFFFEPKDYDEINEVSHEYKEAVKVGYNLFRKWVFMTIWALTPLMLLADPSLFGLMTPHIGPVTFIRNLGLLWLGLGLAGLLFRTVQLFFVRDPLTGIAWAVKIVSDPFYDIKLYHKAPVLLIKGERFAPAH
jgi:hypothetical protein